MNLFNTEIPSVQGSAVTPVQPVKDDSSMSGLNTLAGLFNTGAKLYTKAKEEEKEEAKDSFLNNVELEAKKYIESWHTGSIKKDEALTRVRQLYNKAQASPGAAAYRDQLNDSFSMLVSTAGLGKGLVEESPQEKFMRERTEAAWKAGAVFSWMDESQQQEAVENHWRKVGASEELARLQALQAYENSKQRYQLGVTKGQQAKLNFEQDRLSFQSQQTAYNFVNSDFVGFSNEIENLTKEAELAKNNPEKLKEIYAQMEAKLNTRKAFVTQAGAYGGSSFFEPMLKVYEQRVELAKMSTDPKVDKQRYEDMYSSALALEKFIMFSNASPEDKRLAAFSAIYQGNPALATLSLNAAHNNLVRRNSGTSGSVANPFPKSSEDVKDFEGYKKVVLGAVRNINYGLGDNKLKQETEAQINSILLGIDEYSKSAKAAKDVQPIMEFLADPQFKTAMDKLQINSNAIDAAQDVLQSNYLDKVLPMVLNEWETKTFSKTASGATLSRDNGAQIYNVNEPVKNYLEPMLIGNKVVFKARPGAKLSVDNDTVREMNKRLGSILTRTTMAWSHLSGESYSTVFEKYVKPYAFGISDDDKIPESNVKELR